MITSVHTMFYSSEAEALRAFLRDKLGLPCFDAGEGWLIFDLPGADMGCHPTEGTERPVASGTADISFVCDDIEATMKELKGRGVEFVGGVTDAGWGLTTRFKVPGGFDVMLYQPRYGKGG